MSEPVPSDAVGPPSPPAGGNPPPAFADAEPAPAPSPEPAGRAPRLLTPWQRFVADPRPLELPESDEALRAAFILPENRSVSADRIVSVDGVAYEVPRPLGRERRLTVYRRLLDGTVAVLLDGRLVDLHPVDLVGNARSRRGSRDRPDDPEDPDAPPPPSAADLAFDRDLGPVTLPDGGFPDA
jgi:hypothetical protein